ncbi:MAG: sugar transferase [Cereibacter sphaeroides]|uniref:Sugar transferase n=1 Tax=Cereibacter sphaeroides TaxID=1063 RepID=A0A2W5TPP8_CERSP|nr:MAG: sugar transferase [Cereibacter sphaeroides]
MTLGKRLCDLTLAVVLMAILALPFAILIAALAFLHGRPVFHGSERMCAPDLAFRLWKLRTMRVAAQDAGVSGGDKAARITRVGRFLRRTRIDEVPQLWNILCGQMSFVGPRPPLRLYVERFPALYARVLRNRPGLTGLATLRFHARESRLLAACTTPEETDAVYVAHCITRKAALDLIYQRRQTLRFDLALLLATPFLLAGFGTVLNRSSSKWARR